MKIFISGGCKNGKTSLAEDLAVRLAEGRPHYYIATMIPHDEEDRARIRNHIRSRAGKGFETVECGTRILDSLKGTDPRGVYLLDSVTALLSNEMFRPDGTMDEAAPERVAAELTEFAERAENVVFVSDYIYADGIRYDDWSEAYRRGLARVDRALAAVCGNVAEFCITNAIWYKGGWEE